MISIAALSGVGITTMRSSRAMAWMCGRARTARAASAIYTQMCLVSLSPNPPSPFRLQCICVEGQRLDLYVLKAKGVEEVRGRYSLDDAHALVESRRVSHVVVEVAHASVEEVGAWRFDGYL